MVASNLIWLGESTLASLAERSLHPINLHSSSGKVLCIRAGCVREVLTRVIINSLIIIVVSGSNGLISSGNLAHSGRLVIDQIDWVLNKLTSTDSWKRIWRARNLSVLVSRLDDVELAIWLLDDLPTTEYILLCLSVLIWNRSQKLTWRYSRLSTKSGHWRSALLTLPQTFEARLAGCAHGLSTAILIHDGSHVFASCSRLSEKLLEWSKQNLLRILERDVPIFTLFASIDAYSTNNELLLGIDLNELLFAWDLVADWRHGSVDSSSSR